MHIDVHEIQIWSCSLTLVNEQQPSLLSFLTADERERADRFRFPIHRERYIAARGMLRLILSHYLHCSPHDIAFGYTEYKKPYLLSPTPLPLQFNLSHSENWAVYALALTHPIGVDIEKVEDRYNQDIAERFFSPDEARGLQQLPETEKRNAFYRLWARKEALLKALGKGLNIPLSSFTVLAYDELEQILLENDTWSLLPLTVQEGFQSAAATNQKINKVSYWQLFEQKPALIKVIEI